VDHVGGKARPSVQTIEIRVEVPRAARIALCARVTLKQEDAWAVILPHSMPYKKEKHAGSYDQTPQIELKYTNKPHGLITGTIAQIASTKQVFNSLLPAPNINC